MMIWRGTTGIDDWFTKNTTGKSPVHKHSKNLAKSDYGSVRFEFWIFATAQ